MDVGQRRIPGPSAGGRRDGGMDLFVSAISHPYEAFFPEMPHLDTGGVTIGNTRVICRDITKPIILIGLPTSVRRCRKTTKRRCLAALFF